jgi:hypothetical protein
MLDAFPRSTGDHLAQNFLREIKLISNYSSFKINGHMCKTIDIPKYFP